MIELVYRASAMSSRSLRVHPDYINKVKTAVKHRYPRQKDLALDLGFSLATVSNFLNGKPVDNPNFHDICRKLDVDGREIAEWNDDSDEQESLQDQEPSTSKLYVERVPYESEACEEIFKPGALVRIKAPQQMGKTSFLSRLLSKTREQDCQTLTLSFELADSTVFTDLRQFSRWFCASVGQNLGLSNQLDEYWDDIFGCNSNTTTYFEDYLLPKIASPVVLALDEVDLVFEHPNIADDFCRLLRGWYDKARRGDRNSTLWRQLRLVVVHSTEVYSALDINHSPLANVGRVIELPELTPDEVLDLAQRHGLDWNATQVQQLMAMVGGHPYLVQLALDYIQRQEVTLQDFLKAASTEAGIYRNHLRRHLSNLQQNPELMDSFREVVKTNSWVMIESDQLFKLHSMGLVKLQGNAVMPSCDLYLQYFRERF